MDREDGFNAGYRRIGTLALYTIPLVLGAAACVWLGFSMAAHGWFNLLSQEDRRAIYVGAKDRPKSKMNILTPNTGCIKIDRVDLDGSTAAVYFHSECISSVGFAQVKWQLISPDGTALGSGRCYVNLCGGPSDIERNQKGEVVLSGFSYGISTDDRAQSISFKISE